MQPSQLESNQQSKQQQQINSFPLKRSNRITSQSSSWALLTRRRGKIRLEWLISNFITKYLLVGTQFSRLNNERKENNNNHLLSFKPSLSVSLSLSFSLIVEWNKSWGGGKSLTLNVPNRLEWSHGFLFSLSLWHFPTKFFCWFQKQRGRRREMKSPRNFGH